MSTTVPLMRERARSIPTPVPMWNTTTVWTARARHHLESAMPPHRTHRAQTRLQLTHTRATLLLMILLRKLELRLTLLQTHPIATCRNWSHTTRLQILTVTLHRIPQVVPTQHRTKMDPHQIPQTQQETTESPQMSQLHVPQQLSSLTAPKRSP